MLEKLRLDRRTVILMGAAGGNMGTATAKALCEAGAAVVGVDLTEQALGETAVLCKGLDGRFLGVAADVRQEADIDRVLATAIAEFGGADGLVNLVGGTQPGQWWPMEEMPNEVWEATLALNLTYVFKTCRAVGRHMIETGRPGSMVNFASVSGHASAPYHGCYGAAKAAVMSLTKTMAVEWGPHNIRVNCLSPSGSRGPRNARIRSETSPPRKSPAALPRAASADDFAAACLYLLSDLSAWITGAVLSADGGMTAQSPLGDTSFFADHVKR
ncbi:MAG: SDR family oxidoreductase [Caulobacteraceae bacterium]|nr:SDR family oxidoreductase [Caulobacteraceae bacterium]